MRLRAGVLAASIVCAVLGVPGAGRAQTSGVPDQSVADALDLSPGATCLEATRLEAEVRTWLGRDRLQSDVHVHVQGDAEDPRAVEFRIVREGKARERRFDGLPAGCEDATAVVGLAIALAIDASVVTNLVAPAPPLASTPGPPAKARRAFAVQLGAGFEVVPGASLGAGLGFEYGLADWLSARVDWMTQFSWNNSIAGASGVFDAVAAAAWPQICTGGNVTDRFRLELCSGAALGLIHVQGRDYTVSRSGTGAWIVASGGIRLLFVAGIPWAVDVDGVFPLHAPAFRAEIGTSDVYRDPSSAGALLSVGPAFTF